ncbi:MAG: clostripain-related cysteine peptidase [Elusimicrobia bacterium]|nr:clostripain-related cysteine peptidase [Elusimicrobiota bacterium]
MFKKFALSAVTLSMLGSLASAEIGFDGGAQVNLKEELGAVEVPSISPASPEKGIIWDWLFGKQPAEWTIMVFVNGKNNLEPFALKDMNEMEVVGSTAKLNIVVEAGRMDGYDTSDGDWKGTRRFLIKKDKDLSKVTSPVVQDLGKVDMGDYKSVVDFGKWAKQKYPAKKYMLIVWNHGSGWEKGIRRPISKGISYDDETNNHINTPQLGQILKDIGGVDLYGSDACLMQMAEVVYELKDNVKYIVGSEETEPGDGYTYDTFLGPLAAKPAMTPEELARTAVDAYSDHYKGGSEGSTQSFLKAASIPKLLTLTNDFSYAVTQAGEKDLAKSARDAAVGFAIPENKDLYDFVSHVVAGTKNPAVAEKGKALMSFITGGLVMYNRTNNSAGGFWSGPVDYGPAKGISIYMPSSGQGDGYADLQWAKYSNWDEFITWMNS